MTLYHIQNSDINVGPHFYKDLQKDQLIITKIFYTIQGEGPFAGMPAAFIRLSGCNRGTKETMGCQFCDTFFKYADGKIMTFDDIHEEVKRQVALENQVGEAIPLIVITGGEPMMQDNLVKFIETFNLENVIIQIESNGDRLAKGFLTSHKCDGVELVVSPKVVRDGYHDLRSEVRRRANVFKFVVDHRVGSPYNKLPDYIADLDGAVICLSPLTVYKRSVLPGEVPSAWDPSLVDHELTAKNYAYAVRLAKENCYRVSMQQHLFYQQE